MKKLYGFILLVAAVFLMTGCSMKMHVGLEVAKDGKVSATILTAYDNEMLDGMIAMKNGDMSETPKENTDADRWAYIDSDEETESYKDYKKVKYEEDGFKGYTYTQEIGKIEDLVATGDEKISMDEMGKGSKLFTKEGNVYKLNIKASEEASSESTAQYEQMGASFDTKFYVKLPAKAKSHNATEVSKDGLTYTWDLLKAKDIQLEFEMPAAGSNLLPIIIGAAACVVVVAVVCCVVLSKKKKNNAAPSNPTVA